MSDMHTLAFPQALGTGMVVQVRPQLSDSGEKDNQASHRILQMTNSAESDSQAPVSAHYVADSPESDNHAPGSTSHMTDSGESDSRTPDSSPHMTDSGETDTHAPDSAPCVTDSGESDIWGAISAFLDGYERALSRFREDSLVAAMRRARHGGSFDFPDWAAGLFDLYDALHEASAGAIDPCVGEDLTRLGYGPAYTFTALPDAGERVGAIHGRSTWSGSVERHGCTLVTRGPVSLDFGACGKGYAVDLIASLLRNDGCAAGHGDTDGSERNVRYLSVGDPFTGNQTVGTTHPDHADKPDRFGNNSAGFTADRSADLAADRAFVIDAGGDLLVHLQPSDRASRTNGTTRTTTASRTSSTALTPPLRIALEHPTDTTQAIGVAEIASGALCASAPSRRHWGEQAGMKLHHLLNAIDGLPADNIAAAWAYVREQDAAFPCATADGLATALFVTPPDRLRARFRFECAFIDANGMAHASRDFPATLFLA